MLTRHPANPVLKHTDCPFPATTVFNAGVARHEGRYVMLFRNDYGRWGDPNFDGTNLGLATSADGITWDVAAKPVLDTERARAGLAHLVDSRFGPEEIRRVYDPRITVIEGRPHVCFAVDTRHGILGGVAVTDDFSRYEFLCLSAPDNRNMVLFPERFGGRYLRLERPFPIYGRGAPEAFDLWASYSPDLRHWGETRLVLGSEELPFVNNKIGPAVPPVRTSRGWLAPIHAVFKDPARRLHGWEANPWTKTYYAGLMLLDLEDPRRVIGLMRRPLLAPEAIYEREGFRGDVIFPCGFVVEDSGEARLYYGAADTCVALATGHVDELVAACEPLPSR
ncbi:MAG: glycoside hydrolase family 130 protein [Opitutaceae bacterium]|jgi:beta-1,4-mannooligosaccharide/beta-1,4-mannosyl-N-acetylglucosamine phosphorylase|nr:glycoside hydrolase family 130 protein [Opitutaceae bacterium]